MQFRNDFQFSRLACLLSFPPPTPFSVCGRKRRRRWEPGQDNRKRSKKEGKRRAIGGKGARERESVYTTNEFSRTILFVFAGCLLFRLLLMANARLFVSAGFKVHCTFPSYESPLILAMHPSRSDFWLQLGVHFGITLISFVLSLEIISASSVSSLKSCENSRKTIAKMFPKCLPPRNEIQRSLIAFGWVTHASIRNSGSVVVDGSLKPACMYVYNIPVCIYV